ncbi:DUF4350 domain-containing protein [Planosporangium mesophilum]|nr:DUF4350 domain-containing protein [Planosporangium mesophilum]NJC84961.1 DUF4350 domain-containing protein [Planosporangium mesophilum]
MRTRIRTRRLRLVAPPALVVLLMIFSAVAYALQQPDESDPAFLSPASEAPIGAARLARLVEQRGVTVERATRTSDALVAAYRGGVTLFVPAPALVNQYYLRMLTLLPASTRLVLVAPTDSALSRGRLPISVADRRWATAVEPPGCDLPAAASAGAAARRESFTAPEDDAVELRRCYRGGLVELRWYSMDLTVIGANDVFRNDRIGEHGNAALATDLLTGTGRLVWLDVHRLEPPPAVDPGASPGSAPPSLAPASPDPDLPTSDPDRPGSGSSGGDGGSGDGGGGSPPSVWSAFPPAAWATLALLLAAGVLMAAARGRRLDGPVPERLPVTVPAAETVLGRGRLYRRARARDTALSTRATATRQRLGHLFDLPADAHREALVAATAAQAGWSAADVDSTLYPPTPADDEQLVAAVANLDGLLRAVTRTDGGELR